MTRNTLWIFYLYGTERGESVLKLKSEFYCKILYSIWMRSEVLLGVATKHMPFWTGDYLILQKFADVLEQRTISIFRIGEQLTLICLLSLICSEPGVATGYGLDDRWARVQVPVGSRIFSSPQHPDRLWGAPSLPCNEYEGLFSRG
jgi:hypothetical protein